MTMTVYEIKDVRGVTIAEHVRMDWPGGRKRMHWRVPGCDPRDGLGGLSTPDLPLYGSERIPSFEWGRPVVITEGERPCDVLCSLGIPALGTVTGASAVPGEDALAVLLPFDVVLWPDHDREGWRHMNRVAWRLHHLGGHLPRSIEPGVTFFDGSRLHFILPKGFDAADMDRRADRRRVVEKLIRAAVPWNLHPEPSPAPKSVRGAYFDFERKDRVEAARAHLLQIVEARLGPPRETRQGTPWWCCPFHAEKSPSFKVDTRESFYRCFGCGARGDVFTFLREIEGTPFRDAIRELAPAAGIGGIPRYWS